MFAWSLWRRDDTEYPENGGLIQTTLGPYSPAMSGTFGDVHLYAAPPAPAKSAESAGIRVHGSGNHIVGNKVSGFDVAYDVNGNSNYMAHNVAGAGRLPEPVIPATIDASLEVLATEELKARVALFVSFLFDLNATIQARPLSPAFSERMEEAQIAFSARSMEGLALRNEMLNRLAIPLTTDIHRMTFCLEAGSAAGADPFVPTARALQALSEGL